VVLPNEQIFLAYIDLANLSKHTCPPKRSIFHRSETLKKLLLFWHLFHLRPKSVTKSLMIVLEKGPMAILLRLRR
jgi:hypothetical protein